MFPQLEQLRFGYENTLFAQLRSRFRGVLNSQLAGSSAFDSRKGSLLGDAVRITPDLLPEVYATYQSCLDAVGGSLIGDLYIQQNNDYNANVLGRGNRFDVLDVDPAIDVA